MSATPHPSAQLRDAAYDAAYARATNELRQITFYSGEYRLLEHLRKQSDYIFVFRLVDVPDAIVTIKVMPTEVTMTGGWFPQY